MEVREGVGVERREEREERPEVKLEQYWVITCSSVRGGECVGLGFLAFRVRVPINSVPPSESVISPLS